MKTLVGQVLRRMQALSRMPKVIMLMSSITIFTVTSNASNASPIRNITAKEILNLSVNRLVEAAASVARNYAEITYDAAVRMSIRDTRRYVKRQITWFKHNYIPYKIILM